MTCSIKHEKVDALVASCTRLVRKASIGITTYIANGLCGGAPFSPRFSGGHGTRKAAITLGLQVDRAFTTRINEHRHSAAPLVGERVTRIIAELGRQGVHMVASQVKVGMVENGVAIRTELDGLGCRADGAPVVVEIKATGASLKEHQAGYRNVCIKRQRMLSGHPNTLENRHQIQVAFGALCCGTRAGIIVVSCRDGVTSYPLRSEFVERRLFGYKVTPISGRPTKDKPHIVMPSWPVSDGPLLDALPKRMHRWAVSRDALPASARLTGPGKADTAAVCIVIGDKKPQVKAAVMAVRKVEARHRFVIVRHARGWRSSRVLV